MVNQYANKTHYKCQSTYHKTLFPDAPNEELPVSEFHRLGRDHYELRDGVPVGSGVHNTCNSCHRRSNMFCCLSRLHSKTRTDGLPIDARLVDEDERYQHSATAGAVAMCKTCHAEHERPKTLKCTHRFHQGPNPLRTDFAIINLRSSAACQSICNTCYTTYTIPHRERLKEIALLKKNGLYTGKYVKLAVRKKWDDEDCCDYTSNKNNMALNATNDAYLYGGDPESKKFFNAMETAQQGAVRRGTEGINPNNSVVAKCCKRIGIRPTVRMQLRANCIVATRLVRLEKNVCQMCKERFGFIIDKIRRCKCHGSINVRGRKFAKKNCSCKKRRGHSRQNNIMFLCSRCNFYKNDRSPEELAGKVIPHCGVKFDGKFSSIREMGEDENCLVDVPREILVPEYHSTKNIQQGIKDFKKKS